MKLKTGKLSSDISRWVKSYYKDLRNRTDKVNTKETYEAILNKLIIYSHTQDDLISIEQCDREFFIDFLEWCENESGIKYAKKTKVLHIAVTKALFGYIADHSNEHIDYSGAFKKILPKGAAKGKKVKYLSEEETKAMINYLEMKLITANKSHYLYIYSLGIKLMLFGGLRISEVLSLKLEDIKISDLKNDDGQRDIYEIALKDTKSAQEQFAYVRMDTIEKEINYFKNILQSNDYIFKKEKGTVYIKRSNFYVGVKNHFEKAGINKKGLHIFRHTCAMQLYRKTGDVLVTKKKLRHSSINTTMIYAAAEDIDVANATRKII